MSQKQQTDQSKKATSRILICGDGIGARVEIDGPQEELVQALATAIVEDEEFRKLTMSAFLTIISELRGRIEITRSN